MHFSGNVTYVTKRLNNKLFTKQTLGFTHSLNYPICGPTSYYTSMIYHTRYGVALLRQLEFPALALGALSLLAMVLPCKDLQFFFNKIRQFFLFN
jgi:hypothetical protein